MSHNPARKIRRARQRAAARAEAENLLGTQNNPSRGREAAGVVHGVCRGCSRRRLLVRTYRICDRCHRAYTERLVEALDETFGGD